MYEQGLAGSELAALEDIVPDREKGLGNRRGLDHRQIWWRWQSVAFECQAVFGVAAADYQRHHFVSLSPARDAGADRHDFASDF